MIVLLGLMIAKDQIQYPTDLTNFQEKNIPIERHERGACMRATSSITVSDDGSATSFASHAHKTRPLAMNWVSRIAFKWLSGTPGTTL
jgi:hypothetical protein